MFPLHQAKTILSIRVGESRQLWRSVTVGRSAEQLTTAEDPDNPTLEDVINSFARDEQTS